MRFLYFLPVIFFLWSCKQPVCVKGGKTERLFIDNLPAFENIHFHKGIRLYIQEASQPKMEVVIPEKLKPYFNFEVKNNTLDLKITKQCVFRDDSKAVEIKVYTPALKKIRNASEYAVSSVGTLHFPSLYLVSENYEEPGSPAIGDFRLKLDNSEVKLVANNLSAFYLEGQTDKLIVGFYSRAPRLFAKTLHAKHVIVNHHSNSDLEIYPVDKIEGDIYATGDVLIFHRPPVMDVREHWEGRLVLVSE